MLANFGRNDEAIDMLEKLLKRNPTFGEGYATLGSIYHFRGNLEKASDLFATALAKATTKNQRAGANLKLGMVHLRQHELTLAEAKFAEALQDDPTVQASIDALHKFNENANELP